VSQVRLPTQGQLALPLLEEIQAAGGVARPGELYDRLAARMGLTDQERNAETRIGDRRVNVYERQVRWTRQTCVVKGLIENGERNRWALTDRANAKLGNIVRGKIVTIFETERGFVLWANAEDALSVLARESIELVYTSPPYPLLRAKEYQVGEDRSSKAWIDWMLRLAEGWRELLAPGGSMMINVGPVWEPGAPQQSTYIERFLIALEDRLGLRLCQRLAWESKTKLPAPLEWVGVRRVRVKDTVEPILWVAPDPSAVPADNRRVLKPYSKGALRAIANPEDGTHRRPSGFTFGPSSFRDNGGAIPPALISTTGAAASNSGYHRAVRAAGRTAHPATMPIDVADFCIRLGTTENALVYDPFLGSGTTAVAAERLDRRWIGSERSREYIESARIRFEAEGIRPNLIAA
jgi:DNA modification methylase